MSLHKLPKDLLIKLILEISENNKQKLERLKTNHQNELQYLAHSYEIHGYIGEKLSIKFFVSLFLVCMLGGIVGSCGIRSLMI